MLNVWTSRDLPVLSVIVQAFVEDPFRAVTPEDVIALTGFSQDEVAAALTNLSAAVPPFLDGITIDAVPFPIKITGITERALRAAGEWPDPEHQVMTLIAALNEAASRESNPENRSRLEQAAQTLGGIALQVAMGWASGALPHP
jgi:hypothetical protein